MKRKQLLTYEIYGSASAGENGYWRWLILSTRRKRTLQVGSFYGPLPEAKKQAEAAVVRLNERIRKNPSAVFSRPSRELQRGQVT
jgi:hypothetical protein